MRLRDTLIGARLLGRDQEVGALRRVRDEMLATTPAGREWIALFERAQMPLVAVVLDDQRLARRAADLLARAGALLGDERATLDRDVVEDAEALLRELQERAPSDAVRADLERVHGVLGQMAGRAAAEVVEILMTRGPEQGQP